MSATFRSHLRHPPQGDEPPHDRERSTRTPAKPSATSNEGKSGRPTPHVSRLTKRASKTNTPSDNIDHGTKSTAKAPTSVTAAHDPSARPKRMSVTPASEGPALGPNTHQSSRSNTPMRQPQQMRTPSLVSGTSASTYDSPKAAGLRRKPSTIESYSASRRAHTPVTAAGDTRMQKESAEYGEAFENTVLGISLPSNTYDSSAAYENLRQGRHLTQDYYTTEPEAQRNFTPPVLPYAPSATPSTRYTDSPFSHVPTPSSASSYSSSILAPAPSNTPRTRQQSPTRSRPPLSTKPNEKGDHSRLGLPPVRESSTSSSNSAANPLSSRSTTIIKEVPRKPSAPLPSAAKSTESSRSKTHGRLVKERPQQASSTPTVKPSVQIPPELAHLNVDLTPKPSLNKALPPIRPSRDNTPNLTGMSKPSPVVHSDLPKLYTTYHKRTPSQETPSSPMKSRFGMSSRASSRQESPRIDSAVSPPPAARAFTRKQTPDLAPSEGHKLSRKDSPAVGPGPSPSKSPRFGFLSRKPKPEQPKTLEKPKRQPSKGPVAGTGHEGYGRFTFRGRSGSSSGSAGGRSSSVESSSSSQGSKKSSGQKSSVASKDGSDMDDFLKERLTPVYLRGSGGTTSSTSSGSDVQAPNVSAARSAFESDSKPQLLPSAMHDVDSFAQRHFRQSPKNYGNDATQYPSIAARRSITKLSQAGTSSNVPTPPAINTNLHAQRTPLDSYEAPNSTIPQSGTPLRSTTPLDVNEGLWLSDRLQEPEAKPPRKWNFFQRAQGSPKTKGKEQEMKRSQTPASLVRQGVHPDAHYTMLGPMDQVDLDEVERIAYESITSPSASTVGSSAPSRAASSDAQRRASLLSAPAKPEYSTDRDFIARPPPPRITIRQDSAESGEVLRARKAMPNIQPSVVNIERSPVIPESDDEMTENSRAVVYAQRPVRRTPEMTQVPFNTPEKIDANDSPRQPRLSPIGRIPKVVSRRDRDIKLSDSSFSRPFVRTQPRPTSVKPPGSLYSEIRELASPVEPSSGSQPVSSTSTNSNSAHGEYRNGTNTTEPSVSTARTSMDMCVSPEFMAFPPRKDSEVSYSTSSGRNSYLAPVWSRANQEDDIWNEYNDLMDEVMTTNTPLSTGSSLGAPFQYSTVSYDPTSSAVPGPLDRRQPPMTQIPALPRSDVTSNVLTVPQQIARFMRPSMSPLTPHTLADFYDQYADHSRNSLSTSNRASISDHCSSNAQRSSIPQSINRASLPGARSSVSSSRYSRGSGHSRSASLPEANARHSRSSLRYSGRLNRDTQLLDIAEVEGDEHSKAANLRFGALMTSKWLSNGRVLFSPAHNEMRLSDEPRVLIVDGLGSDWSYYVALSYPSATVYNLGPDAVSSWPGTSQKPPSNHRHIGHAAISAAFPFPKGFFTAVVFRFPVATTDRAYQACIFECKRVLRPGGHLEVTVLDLDLNFMGNKARKAVRGLKTRMQQRDQNVALSNTSDFLLRIIGRKGFEAVQRCIVGVPAAGRVPRSQDISSRSSQSSGKHVWQRESHADQEFSFADLLEDARFNQMEPETKRSDEGITKMVAKVGRMWYTNCYEKALLSTDNSIWNDPALLRECEKQGTSFRLLICHAQKPTQPKRRTVSV